MGGEVELVAAGVFRDEAVGEEGGDGEELAEGAADGVGGLVGVVFAGDGDEGDGGGGGGELELGEALLVGGEGEYVGGALELDA